MRTGTLWSTKHGSDFYCSHDRAALKVWAAENLPEYRLLGKLADRHFEPADPALFPMFERDGFRFHFPV